MPSSRAACDSEPVASMCSSNAILPGPSALSGLKSIRRRIVGVCSFGMRQMLLPNRGRRLRHSAVSRYRYVQINITNGRGAAMAGIRFRKLVGTGLLVLACILTAPAHAADDRNREVLVFAAASLTNVLDEIGAAYTQQTRQTVKFSYAASSALARQLEAGARADVFFSADLEWMDYVQARGLIDRTTRRNVLGNRLALVAPADSKIELRIAPGFALAAALGNGRLATCDPESVPVGKYARSALTSLGIWNDVADRLVRADNVRSALAFIARGETPLGIVYETDAKVERRVRVVDFFPADSHPPIVYPVTLTVSARPAARQFIDFLQSAPAHEAFKKYGFQDPPKR